MEEDQRVDGDGLAVGAVSLPLPHLIDGFLGHSVRVISQPQLESPPHRPVDSECLLNLLQTKGSCPASQQARPDNNFPLWLEQPPPSMPEPHAPNHCAPPHHHASSRRRGHGQPRTAQTADLARSDAHNQIFTKAGTTSNCTNATTIINKVKQTQSKSQRNEWKGFREEKGGAGQGDWQSLCSLEASRSS